MNRSNIEWTEVTWNPTTGCTKISPGCKYCYAERWAKMQQKRGIAQYKNGFQLSLAPNRLFDPMRWKRPSKVFVNSMSDLFHEDIQEPYINRIFQIMNQTPIHQFQILTKRIDRVVGLSKSLCWSDNIWLGVSVESEDEAGRIDLLKRSSAQIKFVSFEPLLGDISYNNYYGLSWIVVGGESGGRARKVEKEWVLKIRDNCKRQNIPFFFKQWGKRIFNPDLSDPTLVKAHPLYAKGGCMIDGQVYKEFPTK
ncbi:phage Gp37/Gp68 family protein [Pseudoflavitalea sp. X16]|uniref:DUF5131 family protein n=1 Tax=Paraflavitalea devenefica TaxID=2716334 RepID=UPI001421506E|nr:phage Gp37/Gp68 family protein [Paraflavitalea devenefica]NII27589.1 phage Gp37/Gp68 family protein [Paraflavitalea devenefica]